MKIAAFDLDNTLINYNQAAYQYSITSGIESINSIFDLKLSLRASDPSGIAWQRAQAYIYTDGLQYAVLNESAVRTFNQLMKLDFDISIVSHKTEVSPFDTKRTKLREIAKEWIKNSELAGILDIETKMYFCSTRESKVAKIAEIRPVFFVDDLQEVLEHRDFPAETLRFWFNQLQEKNKLPGVIQITSLNELLQYV